MGVAFLVVVEIPADRDSVLTIENKEYVNNRVFPEIQIEGVDNGDVLESSDVFRVQRLDEIVNEVVSATIGVDFLKFEAIASEVAVEKESEVLLFGDERH